MTRDHASRQVKSSALVGTHSHFSRGGLAANYAVESAIGAGNLRRSHSAEPPIVQRRLVPHPILWLDKNGNHNQIAMSMCCRLSGRESRLPRLGCVRPVGSQAELVVLDEFRAVSISAI